MKQKNEHIAACSCDSCKSDIPQGMTRKQFLRTMGAATLGLGLSPLAALAANDTDRAADIAKYIGKGKKQKVISLLHTSDIHGQVNVHDEFFWEDGKAVFKKRGGFAHLKTMINELRRQNPNTLLLDGGDCFQGSGIASLTLGEALVPMMNNMKYDLMLPGNWEVVYGKKILLRDFSEYSARKICANMFNDDEKAEALFQPYTTFTIAGIKIGFIGYNDPLTPIRQAPDYSKGIRFTEPEKNLAQYVRILRDKEQCKMVFVMSHMGLAQQLNLASQPFAEGVDYILGADTHERIREPIPGKFSKVTEPGAFASFIGKLDILVEDGKVVNESYQLLEVDPEKYAADTGMQKLIEKAYAPHKKTLNRVIGKTSTTLMRYFVIETPLDNLINDAMMWKFKPDICISNGFRFCPPLVVPPGGTANITVDYVYSMVPSDSELRMADVKGSQIVSWLEKELENVFAKDPTKRLGGWLVRFKGMTIKFTIEKEMGHRLEEVLIGGVKLDPEKIYKALSCEREGDPDDVLCRIKNVKNNHRIGAQIHKVLEEYLAVHSPVAPAVEGRATATDAPPTLLTQVSGVNYQFR